MQRIAVPENRRVTPKEAAVFLEKNLYLGQRNERAKLISRYAKEIEKDEFFSPTILFAQRNYNGGEKVLLNGQHTLRAIIAANKPILATIETWGVESPSDEAALYSKFDGTGGRSQGDYVHYYAVSNGIDAPDYICNAVVSAAAMKDNSQGKYAADKAGTILGYENHIKFFKLIFEDTIPKGLSKMHVTKHIRRKPVYYAMLLTFEKCQRDAEKFWIDVRDGQLLSRKQPTFHLREFLLTTNYSHGMGATRVRTSNMHEMASRCINAWNAYREGRTVKILKYFPNAQIPSVR